MSDTTLSGAIGMVYHILASKKNQFWTHFARWNVWQTKRQESWIVTVRYGGNSELLWNNKRSIAQCFLLLSLRRSSSNLIYTLIYCTLKKKLIEKCRSQKVRSKEATSYDTHGNIQEPSWMASLWSEFQLTPGVLLAFLTLPFAPRYRHNAPQEREERTGEEERVMAKNPSANWNSKRMVRFWFGKYCNLVAPLLSLIILTMLHLFSWLLDLIFKYPPRILPNKWNVTTCLWIFWTNLTTETHLTMLWLLQTTTRQTTLIDIKITTTLQARNILR